MMINHQQADAALFSALSAAQGEIGNATKNASNPHFKSKYADLAEVLDTIRPVFAKHGLSLVQSPSFDGDLSTVTTIIGHKDGGMIVGQASCKPAKTDAQGIGATITYLRRYSAAAFAGIAQDDDDGNEAAHDGKPKATQRKTTQKAAAKPAAEASRSEVANKYVAAAVSKYGLTKEAAAGALKSMIGDAGAANADELPAEAWAKVLEDFTAWVKEMGGKPAAEATASTEPEQKPEDGTC